MEKYKCEPCGYIYDPVAGDSDEGIDPGTSFQDIPDDLLAPRCGVTFYIHPCLNLCHGSFGGGHHWLRRRRSQRGNKCLNQRHSS